MEYLIIATLVILLGYFITKKKNSRIKRSNDNDFHQFIFLALKHFISRNYQDAINVIDNLNDQYHAEIKEAYDIRGMSLTNLGFGLDAIDDFSNSIRINPNDANIFFLRATEYQFIGEYTLAHKDFKRAVELDSGIQLYHDGLDMIKRLLSNSAKEEYAKKAALEKGRLIRRIKKQDVDITLMPDSKSYSKGLANLEKTLNDQANYNPQNIHLRKILNELRRYTK